MYDVACHRPGEHDGIQPRGVAAADHAATTAVPDLVLFSEAAFLCDGHLESQPLLKATTGWGPSVSGSRSDHPSMSKRRNKSSTRVLPSSVRAHITAHGPSITAPVAGGGTVVHVALLQCMAVIAVAAGVSWFYACCTHQSTSTMSRALPSIVDEDGTLGEPASAKAATGKDPQSKVDSVAAGRDEHSAVLLLARHVVESQRGVPWQLFNQVRQHYNVATVGV
jgi:hypothetical protein